VFTIIITGQAKQATAPQGWNPRRSTCVELSMDLFSLGRPHTSGPAAFVPGGGTA
jgi:hypothetical protein